MLDARASILVFKVFSFFVSFNNKRQLVQKKDHKALNSMDGR